MFKFFILLVFFLSLAYAVLMFLITLFDPVWYNILKGRKPDIRLSYEDFMKYYNLALHKYQLDDNWKHLVKYEDHNYHYIWIGFNIIDTYKVIYIY